MVSSKIDFNKNGLSTTEAKIRLKKYGENIVVKKKK
jgi:hypothetical protein